MGKDKQAGLVRERRNGMPTRRVDGTEGTRYVSVAPAHQASVTKTANTRTAQKNQETPNHPCIEQRGFCHNPSSCPYVNIKPSVCWMLLKHGACNGRQNQTCQWDHPRNPMQALRPGVRSAGGGGMIRMGPALGAARTAEVCRPPSAAAAAAAGGGSADGEAFPSLGAALQRGPSEASLRGDDEASAAATDEPEASAPATPLQPQAGHVPLPSPAALAVQAAAAPQPPAQPQEHLQPHAAPAPAAWKPPPPAAAAPAAAPPPAPAAPARPQGAESGELCSLRVGVPNSSFQRIIGRKGERRKSFEDRHGVTLHVPGPEAGSSAQVTVAGPPAAAEAARRELEEEFGEPPQDDQQELEELQCIVDDHQLLLKAAEGELEQAQAEWRSALELQRAAEDSYKELDTRIAAAWQHWKCEQQAKREQIEAVGRRIQRLRDQVYVPPYERLEQLEAQAAESERELRRAREETQALQDEVAKAQDEERRLGNDLRRLEEALESSRNKAGARRIARSIVCGHRDEQGRRVAALRRKVALTEELRDAIDNDRAGVTFYDCDRRLHVLRRIGSAVVWYTLPPKGEGAERRAVESITVGEDGQLSCRCSAEGASPVEQQAEDYAVRLPDAGAHSTLRCIGSLASAAGVPLHGAQWLPQAHEAARVLRETASGLSDAELAQLWHIQERVDEALRSEMLSRLLSAGAAPAAGPAPAPAPAAASPASSPGRRAAPARAPAAAASPARSTRSGAPALAPLVQGPGLAWLPARPASPKSPLREGQPGGRGAPAARPPAAPSFDPFSHAPPRTLGSLFEDLLVQDGAAGTGSPDRHVPLHLRGRCNPPSGSPPPHDEDWT
eukprot:TRINITY_DN8408_c0_g1_i1.p1 TRINITY_DN8408_c0_g1~~TRINITY_DN8408_c0_g1_i1.p1  ORF type:complete len:843 (+),score=221.45 TRINITY_DN8408_c0_g1_i1:94-2622(+)